MYFICGFLIGIVAGIGWYFYQKRRKEELHDSLNELKQKELSLQIQNKAVQQSISELEAHAKQAGDIFYKQNMDAANMRFEQEMERTASQFRLAKENLTNEYLSSIQEESNRFNELLNSHKKEIEDYQTQLNNYKQAVAAAAELAKREQEMKEKDEFYKIQLSEIDNQEIEKLRSVIPYLRDAEPVNKIIWSSYYMRPLNDLISRVCGSSKKTGIYKLTDRTTGLVYIGQSLDVSNRWKEHVRRGVGAEAPTRNKLYPAMQKAGPENFTFELVEECESARLNEREKYWIEYFDSCSSGLNATAGGAKK